MGMSRHGPQYHNCCSIQKRLMNLMMDDGTTPSQVAALSNAWEKIEDRKRILKGKGQPKPVDETKRAKPMMRPVAVDD